MAELSPHFVLMVRILPENVSMSPVSLFAEINARNLVVFGAVVLGYALKRTAYETPSL